MERTLFAIRSDQGNATYWAKYWAAASYRGVWDYTRARLTRTHIDDLLHAKNICDRMNSSSRFTVTRKKWRIVCIPPTREVP